MDAFKKVRAGERLEIAASAWNRVIDQVVTRPRFDGASQASPQINFQVRCRNATTGIVPRWGIMQIAGVLEVPAVSAGATGSGLSSFEAYPGVVGVAPQAGSAAFVVAVEPIAPGAIGHAAIAGVVQSRVLVRCTGHRYATPASSNATYLETSDSGPFRIIWRDSTGPANPTGVTGATKPWALVAFGDERPADAIAGHSSAATQLLGHGKAASGASGCDAGLQWYSVTECSGNPSYATSYFL